MTREARTPGQERRQEQDGRTGGKTGNVTAVAINVF